MNMCKSRFLLPTVTSYLIFASILSAEDNSRWLIPRSILESTDLKIVWQYNLPLGEQETINQFELFGNKLYVLSNRNYLSCVDTNDGSVGFSSVIAPAGLPVGDMQFFQNRIFAVVGNKLIEMNSDLGTEQTSANLACSITCPIVRNDSYYYLACLDNRIHSLKADDKVEVFQAAADNGSRITAMLAEQDFVIFATEAGNIVQFAADQPRKIWQFDAPAGAAGPIVHDAASLYFACRDTNIYRLALSTGRLTWKYQTSGILNKAPQLGMKVVYQYVPDFGMIAVDKEAAKLLWKVPKGIGLLSESDDKAFIITGAGLLVAMDNTKMKQLYTVDFGKPLRFAINSTGSRIYIADSSGRLACIEPKK
jgi:outer membrane protein assembly factor BamB